MIFFPFCFCSKLLYSMFESVRLPLADEDDGYATGEKLHLFSVQQCPHDYVDYGCSRRRNCMGFLDKTTMSCDELAESWLTELRKSIFKYWCTLYFL